MFYFNLIDVLKIVLFLLVRTLLPKLKFGRGVEPIAANKFVNRFMP